MFISKIFIMLFDLLFYKFYKFMQFLGSRHQPEEWAKTLLLMNLWGNIMLCFIIINLSLGYPFSKMAYLVTVSFILTLMLMFVVMYKFSQPEKIQKVMSNKRYDKSIFGTILAILWVYPGSFGAFLAIIIYAHFR